ncbi:MAG: DHH family phosphoesterase, partial [Rhodothermia bacterium]|nr:DHH family phosphoesterase [Rhodothermia bacterium]
MSTHTNSIIDRNHRFVVTTHTRPDGDAIGSQLAMGRMLSKLGKDVLLISADPPARNLDWLPGSGQVEIYDGSIAQREFIAAADLIIVVDTNVEDRLGSLGEPVRHSGAEKMVIDHHPDGENWFDHRYVRESASSTGELIFELITDRGLDLIDHDLATALYVAIMTDTGSFRYSNVSATVHRIIADLIENGSLDPEFIHRK